MIDFFFCSVPSYDKLRLYKTRDGTNQNSGDVSSFIVILNKKASLKMFSKFLFLNFKVN